MKPHFLYPLIIIVYLFAIGLSIATLGTLVSKKYEVDENYWRFSSNSKLSDDQKKAEIAKLDKKGKQLDIKIYLFAFLGLTSFTIATGMIIFRKKILPPPKNLNGYAI